MAITFATAWPAALTDKEWQKKKSFLDKSKSKTKTGLGATLTAAQNAWNGLHWDTMKADKQVMPTATLADQKKQAAQTYKDTTVAAASRLILAAAQKAKETKTNKALSKTAQQAAGTIETGLLAQSAHLRDINFNDFDQHKQQVMDLTMQTMITGLKSALKRANTFIQDVESTQDLHAKAVKFSNGVAKASRDITQNSDNIGVYQHKADPKSLADPLREWNDASTVHTADTEVDADLHKFKGAVQQLEHWAA